jgi:hypothetical protein
VKLAERIVGVFNIILRLRSLGISVVKAVIFIDFGKIHWGSLTLAKGPSSALGCGKLNFLTN